MYTYANRDKNIQIKERGKKKKGKTISSLHI